MFSKFKEKNTTCVELKDVTDPRIMSQIIHYMYFNAVSLSPATVQDILSIANYLQIDSLTAACVQFIKERYKGETCIKKDTYKIMYFESYDVAKH